MEEIPKRSNSPRVVSLVDFPFFRTKQDIEGEAFFRLFTGSEEPGKRVPRAGTADPEPTEGSGSRAAFDRLKQNDD